MTSVLLEACLLVVTEDDAGRELPHCSIVIEDGWITYVGVEPREQQYDQRIDCRSMVVVPGLINTHHHLYQTLTRGFAESEGQPLFPWLQQLYPIWAGLDEEMVFASTQAGLAELALSGCTTSSDHLYLFPPGSDNFIDAQVEAAGGVGVRFHATRGSMDLGQSNGGLPPDSVVQPREVILKDSERVIQRYHDPSPGAMIRIGLAPCSPFSASPELMLETAGLAREMGVRLHTHLAETLDEEAFSLREFGVRPVELLDRVSWLEEDVWLAHCVHISSEDVDLFARRGVGVAHCPTSNMLLGSGLARVPQMVRSGVRVGLGVDGSASNDGNDLRAEVKQAVLSARAREGAGALSVRRALKIATRGGASCLGREDVGSIAEGKAADLVLFDGDALSMAGSATDLVAGIVLGAVRPHSVFVHGRAVVRDGELLTADVAEIASAQRTASARLMNRWSERAGLRS
jgi:cytosine/adenosine deaminase-related metal-dependent hydrolase